MAFGTPSRRGKERPSGEGKGCRGGGRHMGGRTMDKKKKKKNNNNNNNNNIQTMEQALDM